MGSSSSFRRSFPALSTIWVCCAGTTNAEAPVTAPAAVESVDPGTAGVPASTAVEPAVLQEQDPATAVDQAGVVGDDEHRLVRRRPRSPRTSASTSWPLAESRLAVGSSARRSGGSLMSARARATRCFSPAESSSGRWCHPPLQAQASREDAAARLAPLAPAHPGQSRRQGYVLERGERREQVERLEDEPDAHQAQLGQLAGAAPVQRPRLRASPRPVVGVSMAPRDHEQRGLAGARRAHHEGHLAGAPAAGPRPSSARTAAGPCPNTCPTP